MFRFVQRTQMILIFDCFKTFICWFVQSRFLLQACLFFIFDKLFSFPISRWHVTAWHCWPCWHCLTKLTVLSNQLTLPACILVDCAL